MSSIDARRRPCARGLALGLALAIGLVAARAHAAAKTATLLGVSGPDGARFAAALERDLSELYDVVPGAAYRRVAGELGARGASPAEVRAVAARLHVDAIIGGSVVGTGRARRLLLAVREGATGRVIARGSYDLGGRTLPLVRQQVVRDLVRALDRVHPVGSVAVAPAGGGSGEDDDRAAAAAPGSSGGRAAPDDSSAAGGALATDAGVSRAADSARATPGGVFAGVGPALLTRRLGFDVASAPSYSGGTVFGIRADGAVFPLALSAELAEQHPVLASFGLAGSFEQIIDFTSSTPSGGASVAHASRWKVLFVGRIPLGHAARGGTLVLDTGFQRMSWSHAAPVDVGIPDVRYDAVAAGLGWDKTLAGRWLALALRAGYLGVLTSGDIASAGEYGPARGWGLSAAGSLTVSPLAWLWIRVEGDYDFVGLRFAGAGTRFAHSSADHWIGGALEVGFAL